MTNCAAARPCCGAQTPAQTPAQTAPAGKAKTRSRKLYRLARQYLRFLERFFTEPPIITHLTYPF